MSPCGSKGEAGSRWVQVFLHLALMLNSGLVLRPLWVCLILVVGWDFKMIGKCLITFCITFSFYFKLFPLKRSSTRVSYILFVLLIIFLSLSFTKELRITCMVPLSSFWQLHKERGCELVICPRSCSEPEGCFEVGFL